uniref:Glutathione S-transferase n=1 Tax=Panagrolaimus sp. PS1159 TaxID=55785 RepID=A0AC35FTD9_9BILA
MPEIKLVYFDLRGLGETARLILKYAKVDFKEDRISMEQWPELKATTKTGKLPYLEYDGHLIVESNAINRFLARKYGLAGKDDFEEALVDGIADVQKDFMMAVIPWYIKVMGYAPGNPDPLKQECLFDSTDRFFPIFLNFLKESKSGFMAPSGLTWVDFVITEWLTTLQNLEPTILSKHSELKEYIERVHNVSQLKEYYANRPFSKN